CKAMSSITKTALRLGLICFMTASLILPALAQSAVPREKVHLHLDKQSYAAGDTLWFKAYLVLAENNILSTWSKVLHVELINAQLQTIDHILLPLSSGLASGNLVLPDSLQEGRYRIRAYTNW